LGKAGISVYGEYCCGDVDAVLPVFGSLKVLLDVAFVLFPFSKNLAVVYATMMKTGNVQCVLTNQAIGVNDATRCRPGLNVGRSALPPHLA